MKKVLLSLGILITLQVFGQNNVPQNVAPSLGTAPIATYFDEGSPQFSPSTNALLPIGCNRQGVIDDYVTNYLGTTVSTTELAWTGSTSTCTPGTCSTSSTAKCLQRINYYRRLVGLPDNITFDQTAYEAGCQASSLIMHAQGSLSHNPPNTWACWTQLGYDYAGTSNIALGTHSASAVAMYISDPGTNNTPVGHRRWILYSRASVFGIGSTSGANSLRVFGPTVTPAYMPSFVAYPSAGYFPRDLMMSRWSFSIPNANFSAATVSVTNEAGTPLSITVHPIANGYGDNTIVWEMNTGADLTYTNDQDVVYNVTVSGISNAPQSTYTYKVVAIKTQTPNISTTQTNPGCGNNGLATVSYTAGIKSYLWSNGATTATANNLGTGTYTVTITDKNDCTATTSVTLVSVPYSVTAVPTHPTCGLNNGSISIVPEGVNYTWTGGLSGGNPNNVAAGTYTVTVTAAGGCTATTSVTLVNTAVSSFPYCQDIENSSFGNWQVVNPENNITFIPFTLTNCTSNGSKVIQFPSWAAGLWNSTNTDDLVATFNLTNATSASLVFDVAYKGSYSNFGTILNISAATGCGTNYTSIYNKSGSTLATVTGYEVNTSWQPANCSEWRTETINLSAYLGSVVTLRIRVSADPSNPYMGSYNYGQNLYLDDICVNAVVGDPCASFNVSAVPTQPTCGLINGSIAVTPTGGSYLYSWTGGLSGSNPTNVAPGTYTVTVTNTSGCTSVVSAVLSPSSGLTASAVPTQPTCGLINGSIAVTPTGAASYTWTGGLSGSNPTNVAPGTYTVTVTNTNGCTSVVSAVLSPSSGLTASAVPTQPTCGLSNGSIAVTPTGGSYLYSWTGGLSGSNPTNVAPGTYTVTVTNTSGCTSVVSAVLSPSSGLTASAVPTQPTCGLSNGSIAVTPTGAASYTWTGGLSGTNPTNVAPGTYTVTVTNTSGCTSVVSAVLSPSSGLTANAVPTQPTCGLSNGSIAVTPTGGSYLYSWTGGLSGSNPTNVAPGTYTVTVTNTNGCTSVVSAVLSPSSGLTASAVPTQPTCGLINGSIAVTPTGGSYLYSWTGSLSGSNPTNVAPGTYTVTVTNTSGCTATKSVTLNTSTVVTATIGNIVQAVCNTGGSMGVTASGAVSPYTRLWSNGATTGTINNLMPGVYTVTVTAANGCTNTASATITNATLATPTGLMTTNITATTATLSWNAVVGAANYTILGRKVGASNWTTVGPVNGTSKNIQSQISACKTYEWKVRANCANGVTSSPYSSTVQFTTTGCGSSNKNESMNGEWDNGADATVADFNLLPNPADSWVMLELESTEEVIIDIVVTDIVGKIMSQHRAFLATGKNQINLDIAALPKGYYMVVVHHQGGQVAKKLVVMQK